MKHPSSRALFAYWDDQRGNAKAPDRTRFEPGAVRELLGDSFVLAYRPDAGLPFRVAGTRVCALLGRDVKDQAFAALFTAQSHDAVQDLVAMVVDDLLPTVAGINAVAADGVIIPLELLLLPFNPRPYTPPSLTGLLTALHPVRCPIDDLTLTSWRVLQSPLRRRNLRKLAVARGLTVYEGIR
jgi:hypothetical protein